MKIGKSFFCSLFVMVVVSACSVENNSEPSIDGNPVLTVKSQISNTLFGDSLAFTVNVNDDKYPLSTLKAQLYYGTDKVSETVIRTKVNGDYSAKIYIPYLANVPNGTATLRLSLQNTHFAVNQQEIALPLSRPDYDHLTFVSTTGKEYTMVKTALYQYKLTESLPQKIKGYIKAPLIGNQTTPIVFGWANGAIVQGTNNPIVFSNSKAGLYDVTFNTLTYVGAPFIKLLFGGQEMSMVDDDNYKIEADLTKGQVLDVSGINDFDSWWIDSDYFSKNAQGKLAFVPMSGKYRVTANFKYKYFCVERMTDSSLATLADNGTGAVWIIGEKIGKPSLSNEVGWNTDKAICMAPIATGKYQVTLVAGKDNAGSIDPESINFKFFHQKGWGGEFGEASITSNSTNIIVIAGGGNLALAPSTKLIVGATYILTLDVIKGKNAAVLTVVMK